MQAMKDTRVCVPPGLIWPPKDDRAAGDPCQCGAEGYEPYDAACPDPRLGP